MPPKKAVELATLLIDVNSTANATSSTNQEASDFDVSLAIADAIICRKIFSEATDLYSLVFFGLGGQGANGFYDASDFQSVSFDHIEKLDEIKPGTTASVTIQRALEHAVEKIKDYQSNNKRANIKATIFLLSNLDSTPAAMLTETLAKQLGKKVRDAGIELFVASPDDVINSENKTSKIKFMADLNTHCDATWLSYSECQKRFGIFGPKPTAPRGTPFDFKLDKQVAVKVQMYVKNQDAKIKHPFKLCSKDGQEIKKHFGYSTRPDTVIGMGDLDDIADEDFSTGNFAKNEDGKQTVQKEDLIKGYYYGKTVVPIDDELVTEDFKVDRPGKELSLVQFTSRDNILPQYIQSSARYFLAEKNAAGSQVVLMSLVKEMLEKKVVAIVRYAFNANSNSRIACLIPKMTKNGLPMLIHYVLPHGDDIRSYEFGFLDTEENQLTDYQKDAVNDFVDNLMLDDEDFRPKYVPNPRIQHECIKLRNKALNPAHTIQNDQDTSKILKRIGMPERKEIVGAIASLGAAFNLEINENVRPQLFGNRPLGVDPIEFNQQAKQEDIEMKQEGN